MNNTTQHNTTQHNTTMKHINKIYSFILLTCFSTLLSAAEPLASEPLKVGFVYIGPVVDVGWDHQHDQGRKAIEERFGNKVKTTYVESVKPEEVGEVLDKLVANGNKLIFSTSFNYMYPTLEAARRYPNVKFEHATGHKRIKNLSTYALHLYEARYLAGIVAGSMTQSNTIGYVASVPVPEVFRGINAAMLGAQSVNPKAKIKVIWVNAWFAPEAEKKATLSLIERGADVIMQATDSSAVAQTAEEKGVWVVGSASDMRAYAPTKQLTSVIDDWSYYYVKRVEDVLKNRWKSRNVWGGFSKSMISLAPLNKAIPKAVQDKVKALRKSMINKKFHPFTGPIKTRDGKVLVKAGERMTYSRLMLMDYFVKGIVGRLPK